MSKRYARNPGADQIAEWKAAIAAQHRRQRGRRGRRVSECTWTRADGPGMVRRLPPSREDGRADRPGQSQEPQQDHPHHPGTPGAA